MLLTGRDFKPIIIWIEVLLRNRESTVIKGLVWDCFAAFIAHVRLWQPAGIGVWPVIHATRCVRIHLNTGCTGSIADVVDCAWRNDIDSSSFPTSDVASIPKRSYVPARNMVLGNFKITVITELTLLGGLHILSEIVDIRYLDVWRQNVA